MNQYFKNAILCGEVDYFCLLCEEIFHYEVDMERHIRWENHRKKLKSVTYFPKFKNDCIIKIGNQYYCELCNTVLSTTVKTQLHVQANGHVDNKEKSNNTVEQKKSSIVRDSGEIKILNKIVVTEKEWNSIVDDHCILCEVDLDDVNSHLKCSKHMINLITNKIHIEHGDRVFRKIGTDIFYCFTCKQPFSNTLLESHWDNKTHNENDKQLRRKIVNNGASTSAQQTMSFSDEFKNNMKKMFQFSNTKKKTPGNADIVARLQEFQKEGLDINFEKTSAICKKCKFSPSFTAKSIEEHIKMHKKAENNSPGFFHNGAGNNSSDVSYDDDDDDWTTESADSPTPATTPESVTREENKENVFLGNIDYGKVKSELAKYGKQHHIKLVNAGSKGYCTICDSYISAHIKNFEQHVKGANHTAYIEILMRTSKPAPTKDLKTKPLRDYLRNIFFVKQMDDFWINRKICIDKHSFTFLRHLENNGKYDKIKCFLCNEVFPSDKDQSHSERMEHKSKLFDTKVVVSLKREFVREINDTLFHCGYCNEVSSSWPAMEKHLKTFKHLEKRDQQGMVADMTDDMYGMYMEDTNTAETDIMWMQLMGNRLF